MHADQLPADSVCYSNLHTTSGGRKAKGAHIGLKLRGGPSFQIPDLLK